MEHPPVPLPAELQALPQWVLWRLETRGTRPTKVPYQPDGRLASSTNPATWRGYADVCAALRAERARWSGLGFVFTPDDPYCGIDFDHWVDAKGQIAAALFPWLDRLGGYTELSPSSTGLHVIVRAVTGGGQQGAWGGVYDRARFFTMRGEGLPAWGRAIPERQAVVEAILAHFCPPKPQPRARPTYLPHWSLDTVLKRATDARNGPRLQALWHGSQLTYASASEADLAMLCMLTFWTRDAVQLDALFRRSGRMRPKWDERHTSAGHTYGQMTIDTALARAGACWQGRDGGHPPVWQTYPA